MTLSPNIKTELISPSQSTLLLKTQAQSSPDKFVQAFKKKNYSSLSHLVRNHGDAASLISHAVPRFLNMYLEHTYKICNFKSKRRLHFGSGYGCIL